MSTPFEAHIPEESFELYAMGRLPEEQLESFEEHLLVCHPCQDRLAETDRYVRVMRETCRRLEAAPSRAKAAWNPRLAWGLALAGVLAMTFAIPQFRGTSPVEQEVTLRAMRGVETAAPPRALPGRPLSLRISTAELPVAPAYTLEIADSTGHAAWQGRFVATGNEIVQPTGVSLSPGQYWVRVYAESAERPLLREFSLVVAN